MRLRGWFHRTRHHPATRHAHFVLWHFSRATHRVLRLCVGLIAGITILFAVGLWALSRQPVDSLWLANRINAVLIESQAPVRVSFGAVNLGWKGFREGVDDPIDLHASDILLLDADGQTIARAAEARFGFEIVDLLQGHVFPRVIEVDGALLILTRETVDLIEPSAPDLPRPIEIDRLRQGLRQASRNGVPGTDGNEQDLATAGAAIAAFVPPELRRIQLRNTEMVFRDPSAGLDFRGRQIDLRLERQSNGRITGALRAPFSIGPEATLVRADINIAPDGAGSAELHLTPFRPAHIGQADRFAFLRPIDAPVTVAARAMLDRDLYPARIDVEVSLGSGQVRLGHGTIPIKDAVASLSGSPSRMALLRLHADLMPTPDGRMDALEASGTLTHASDRLAADVAVTVLHLDVADIPTLWPAGIGDNVRNWVVEHVIDGAAEGRASFALESDEKLTDVVLTRAHATADVSNGVFTWMSHMPPIVQAEAHLTLLDTDTLDIVMPHGRQQVGPGLADLIGSNGHMHIIGMSVKDQFSDLSVTFQGGVPSVMALLSEPRLRLLSEHPIALMPSVGEVGGTLNFQIPLKTDLNIDDLTLSGDVHLTSLRLPDAAGHHALEDAVMDLSIDKDGMTFAGRGSLAAIPLTLTGGMDFRRATSPDQVDLRINAAGEAASEALIAAGLPIADFVAGPIAVTAAVEQRHDGSETVRLTGELTRSSLTVAALGYSKPPNAPARLATTLQVAHGKVGAVEPFVMTGEGIDIAATARFAADGSAQITCDRFVMGPTDGAGSAHIDPSGALAMELKGRSLDLQAILTKPRDPNTPADNPTPDNPTPNNPGGANPRPWRVEAHVDHVVLANGEAARGVAAKLSGRGDHLALADVMGAMEEPGQPGSAFLFRIAPRGDARVLRVSATDAGRFLRGMDAVKTLSGGTLVVDADIAAAAGLVPMTGSASLRDGVARNSPFLAKMLQAITLYGLLDALHGPGMAFDRITVPFRYDGHDIWLDKVVAQNASLGLTASGRIGMGQAASAITGTIVPAYFFNTLPGRVPLIGKLFSPEEGGGVFAWRFSADGPIGDPNFSINPVSALTPGFLRGFFDLFHQ